MRHAWIWGVAALALGLPGCSSSTRPVRIGSKAFPESVILGEVLTQLAAHAGARAEHISWLADSGKAWHPLRLGDLDAYCEYTGTLTKELLADENLTSEAALEASLARRGIRMSKPLGFVNSYALGMREDHAARLGIRTISDLRDHPSLRVGLSTPFKNRADGWEPLKARYGLPFRTPEGMEHTLAYAALTTGTVDVIDVYTTDAQILRYKLRVLEDDRKFFPSYAAVILYRDDLQKRAREVVEAFRRLEGAIDAATMQDLNARAVIDHEREAEVASAFLRERLSIEVHTEPPGLAQRLLESTYQHLLLVGVSLALAIAVAVPLGILAARRLVLGQGILALVGIVQTFPALALLSVLIILFRRTGEWPAIAALFVYSLLPIVRNTYLGLHDIALSVRESASALGLSGGARLWLIELPMASRSILAGIKTAAVINVGFATLGGLIGAGGYGDAIVAGLQRDDYAMIMEGALPAVAMALAMQGLFELLERVVVPRGLRLKPAE